MAKMVDVGEDIEVLFKVIVLGDSGVGKTSLIERYVNQEFKESYKATIGTDLHVKEITVGDDVVRLQIWDTAGQERFRSVGQKYFRGTDTCILVFDITNKESFDNLNDWKKEFIEQTNCRDPANFPFLLVGNKGDCQLERNVSKSTAESWAEENNCIAYIESSAKEYSNVNEAFEEVAKHILKKIKFDGNFLSEKRKKAKSKVVVKKNNDKDDDDSVCC